MKTLNPKTTIKTSIEDDPMRQLKRMNAILELDLAGCELDILYKEMVDNDAEDWAERIVSVLSRLARVENYLRGDC
jgi:hypothetical protein